MIDIQLDTDAAKAVVSVDGTLFTEYRYGHYVCRPYLCPVLTPGGQRLTRGYPAEEVEGENQDHYHHRGIYVAHGLVGREHGPRGHAAAGRPGSRSRRRGR